MKKLLFSASSIAIATFILGTSSCKKDDPAPQPAAPVCKLIAATVTPATGAGATYNFSYNSEGKAIQIAASGSSTFTRTLTYASSTINIIQNNAGVTEQKSVLTLNSAGKILKLENRDVNNDTVRSTQTFTYNGNGELLTTKYQSGGSSTVTTTVVSYTAGNLTSFSSAGSITTYEYITDQAFRPGDYWYIAQFLSYGNNFFITNKNLLKSQTSGADIVNFDYTFDSNNNISKLQIISGADITDVDYQYDCQ